MKIAFFVGRFPLVSETFILKQVTGLIDLGHEVTVIASRKGDFKNVHSDFDKYNLAAKTVTLLNNYEKVNLIKLLVLGVLNFTFTLKLKFLKSIIKNIFHRNSRTLFDVIQSQKMGGVGHYDVIIAHFGDSGVSASELRRLSLINGAIATVFHGADMTPKVTTKHILREYKRLFSDWDLMLPVSDFWKTRLVSWGADPKKVHVLRMGVDINVQSKESIIDKKISSPLKALTVARFTQKKGIEYSLEGLAQSNLEVIYTIVGYGELEYKLKNLAQSLVTPTFTTNFAGVLEQREVVVKLKENDVFILTSVTGDDGDMEGIPVALMEAMMMGVIVISTFHSGIPELVKDKLTGFLVPEKDTAQLSLLLNEIQNGKYDLVQIRKNAIEHVDTFFNNRLLIKQLESCCTLLKK